VVFTIASDILSVLAGMIPRHNDTF
jgi:hypothetical protein